MAGLKDMKPPEIPEDEDSRLRSLSDLGLLDTPAEPRFDRLTRLSKRLFDVPTALITLVDKKRQWFKSAVGMDARETGRDVSFCGHAILHDDPLIVGNALEDERFSGNPLVIGAPYIRFYAGRPLRAPDGSRVGTLCLIDYSPRSFDSAEIAALDDLAAIAERELAVTALATIDELTRLTNRRGFRLHLEQALGLCSRGELEATLVFMDLDEFKQINDRHGHAEGDRVLRLVAETLKKNCRQSDMPARLAGDEFVVLLSDSVETDADAFIERVDAAFAELIENKRLPENFAISTGAIQYDETKHSTPEAFLESGDRLMYDAKRREFPAESHRVIRKVNREGGSVAR